MKILEMTSFNLHLLNKIMRTRAIISLTGLSLIEFANIYLYIVKEVNSKVFFLITMSMSIMIGLIIYQHNKRKNNNVA